MISRAERGKGKLWRANLHSFVKRPWSARAKTWMVIFWSNIFLQTMDLFSSAPLLPGPGARVCQHCEYTMYWSFPPLIGSDRIYLVNESIKSIFIPTDCIPKHSILRAKKRGNHEEKKWRRVSATCPKAVKNILLCHESSWALHVWMMAHGTSWRMKMYPINTVLLVKSC